MVRTDVGVVVHILAQPEAERSCAAVGVWKRQRVVEAGVVPVSEVVLGELWMRWWRYKRYVSFVNSEAVLE